MLLVFMFFIVIIVLSRSENGVYGFRSMIYIHILVLLSVILHVVIVFLLFYVFSSVMLYR